MFLVCGAEWAHYWTANWLTIKITFLWSEQKCAATSTCFLCMYLGVYVLVRRAMHVFVRESIYVSMRGAIDV